MGEKANQANTHTKYWYGKPKIYTVRVNYNITVKLDREQQQQQQQHLQKTQVVREANGYKIEHSTKIANRVLDHRFRKINGETHAHNHI